MVAPMHSFRAELVARGWMVASLSKGAVRLTNRNGSVIIAGRHRRCRADTLRRIAAADDFAAAHQR